MIGEAALTKILGACVIFGAKAYKDFAALKAEDFGDVAKALGGAFVSGGDTRADMGDFIKGVQARIADTLDKRTIAEAGRNPEDVRRDRENALVQFNDTLPLMAMDRALFARVDFDAHAIAGAMVEKLSHLNSLFRPPAQGQPRSIAYALAYEIFFQTFELAEQKKAFCETLFVSVHREVLSRLGRIEDKQDRLLAMLESLRDTGIKPEYLRDLFHAAEMDPTIPKGREEEHIREAVAVLVAKGAEKLTPTNLGAEIDAALIAARERMRLADADGALKILSERIESEDEVARHRDRGRARLWAEKADVFRTAFRAEEARNALLHATRLDAENVQYWIDLGDLAITHHSLTEAQYAFEQAESAAQRAGDEPNLAVSLEWIGDVRTEQGDLAGARQAYEAGHAISETLVRTDPRNTGWQRDLSVSHDRIGDIRTAQGDLAGALKAYEAGLAIRETLARADPRNTGWQRDLSVSHIKIGDVSQAQGDLAGALKAYEAGLAIRETLERTDPSNTLWQRDLSVSHNRIGEIHRAQGDMADALLVYQDGLAIIQKLSDADPANNSWQADLAFSYSRIGQVLAAQGNTAEALKHFTEGRQIIADLLARYPDVALWRTYLQNFDRNIARLSPPR